MKIEKYNIRGTEINKIQFCEIESYLEDLGLNTDNAFNLLADEKEFVYVSNGFVRGLTSDDIQAGEWHHFFKKDESGVFEAGKMMFN